MQAVNNRERGRQHLIKREIVKSGDLDKDVVLAPFRPDNMGVGGYAAAIAEVMEGIVPARERTQSSLFVCQNKIACCDPSCLPHALLRAKPAIAFECAHGQIYDSCELYRLAMARTTPDLAHKASNARLRALAMPGGYGKVPA